MTIQYLVTGRQGFTDSHLYSYGEAITKTYGDTFGDLKDDELSNAIKEEHDEPSDQEMMAAFGTKWHDGL